MWFGCAVVEFVTILHWNKYSDKGKQANSTSEHKKTDYKVDNKMYEPVVFYGALHSSTEVTSTAWQIPCPKNGICKHNNEHDPSVSSTYLPHTVSVLSMPPDSYALRKYLSTLCKTHDNYYEVGLKLIWNKIPVYRCNDTHIHTVDNNFTRFQETCSIQHQSYT